MSEFRKAKLRQPTGKRLSNVRTQQKKISIGPILFLYYEEGLVSSNLNSKSFRFHSAHPNLYTKYLHQISLKVKIHWTAFATLTQVLTCLFTYLLTYKFYLHIIL